MSGILPDVPRCPARFVLDCAESRIDRQACPLRPVTRHPRPTPHPGDGMRRATEMTRPRRTPFLCPRCKEPIATVIRSEPWQGGIRRRRKCSCGYRVTTVERVLRPVA